MFVHELHFSPRRAPRQASDSLEGAIAIRQRTSRLRRVAGSDDEGRLPDGSELPDLPDARVNRVDGFVQPPEFDAAGLSHVWSSAA